MFAPIKDVLKVYGDEKVPSLGIKHEGEFELVLREPDGSVATHIRQKNAATEALRWNWFRANERSSNTVVPKNAQIILWQNTATLNPWWTSDRVFVPGTFYSSASYSYTPSTHTQLIQCTFAGGTTRTFQTIGWSHPGCITAAFFGNARVLGFLQAATVLSQPVTQLSTQTLEVNYRVTFQR